MPIHYQAHRYQEIEVTTATPVELVVFLYDGAIASLQKAQEHMAARNIQQRTRCLNKATSIITELQANISFEAGGDIAPSLERLYRYMKERIFQANLHQDAAPLMEIVKLLSSLRGAWATVGQSETRAKGQKAAEGQSAVRQVAMAMGTGGEPISPLAGFSVTA